MIFRTNMYKKYSLANLLSTDAVNPLSSSASMTTTGEEPGTAIGLEEFPKKLKRKASFTVHEHVRVRYILTIKCEISSI